MLTDQVFIWGPGCFMGMALPALLSLEFVPSSTLKGVGLEWSQALMTADGLRHASRFGPTTAWLLCGRGDPRRDDGDAAEPDVDRR